MKQKQHVLRCSRIMAGAGICGIRQRNLIVTCRRILLLVAVVSVFVSGVFGTLTEVQLKPESMKDAGVVLKINKEKTNITVFHLTIKPGAAIPDDATIVLEIYRGTNFVAHCALLASASSMTRKIEQPNTSSGITCDFELANDYVPGSKVSISFGPDRKVPSLFTYVILLGDFK